MRRKARWPGLALAIGLCATGAGAGEPPFPALSDSGAIVPPDTNGAVGPNHLMVMLRSQVKIQNRDGTDAPFPLLGLATFWGPVAPVSQVFGPRVVFDPVDYDEPRDPLAARWVVAACDTKAGVARLLVGVSKTEVPDLNAPVGNRWYMKAIDVGPTTSMVCEYPSIGFSADKVVVQMNLKTPSGSFLRSNIYVFEKAAMYGGALGTMNVPLIQPDPATEGVSQVPAATYDSSVTDVYLVQARIPAEGKLRVYKITGLASPTLETVGEPQGPVWSDGPGDANYLPQKQGPPGCSCSTPPCTIQAGDSRIRNVVHRNGSLWATHTVFLASPDRASVQWWQIGTDATVAQRGLVDDPDDSDGLWHFAYPSLAVNKHGDVLLGYSRFNAAEYAGASWSFRVGGDAPGTLRAPRTIKDGESCYSDADPFPPYRNYWGNYSTTVVDPDDVRMWTIQEYAAGAGDTWGTYWDSPTSKLSITDAASTDEGDSGTTLASFEVKLSLPSSETVTVQWRTEDGTATAGDLDYVPVTDGLVTFDPGETTQTVQVAVRGDIKYESLPESFWVRLFNPVKATLLDDLAEGPILDLDPPPLISINDVQAAEGTPPPSGTTPFSFNVTLTNPSASAVGVHWKVAYETPAGPGNADSGDLGIIEGDLVFAPGETQKPVVVPVSKDATPGEGSEKFRVDLTAPTGGAGLLRASGYGVILDDDQTNPPVIGLAVISDNARNRLQWVNPLWSTTPFQVVVRFDSGVSCTAPSTVLGGAGGFTFAPGSAGTAQLQADPNTLANNTEYCYTVFLDYGQPLGGGPYSSGVSARGTPFDHTTGPVKWKYSPATSATSLAPPALHLGGVLAPSNDNYVHGMQRGASGGVWPVGWSSANLGSAAQARSPIVTLGGVPRMYLTTDGWVHAIRADTGAREWDTQISDVVFAGGGAAPAGIFTAFGGAWNYILVGTRLASGNRFYALDPLTGVVIDYYPQVGDPLELGAVTSMATVDYELGQVYFSTLSTSPTQKHTLWCLKLGPPSNALQSGCWERQKDDNVPEPGEGIGNIDSSPSLRGQRLYVMNDAGRLWSIDRRTGDTLAYYDTGSGNIKGFPFLDRNGLDIYFTTASGDVWAIRDNGNDVYPGTTSSLSQKWKKTATNPSIPLLTTLTGVAGLYFGDRVTGTGAVIKRLDLDYGDPVATYTLEAQEFIVGAPSFDSQYKLLHVGSQKGVFYAVALN
jgi:hypothetical protein